MLLPHVMPQHWLQAAGVAAEGALLDAKEAKGEGPPIESLAMAVETILSRQGRVDIILSCPTGEGCAANSRFPIQ
jgi:hypothetical protein